MNKAENEELFGDFGNIEDLNDMESGRSQSEASFMDERLREMNKKLPDWNLEPPFSFLK